MVQSAKLIPSLNLKALPSHRAYARLCGSARTPGQGLQPSIHLIHYTIYDIHLYNIHDTLCGIARAWARVTAKNALYIIQYMIHMLQYT